MVESALSHRRHRRNDGLRARDHSDGGGAARRPRARHAARDTCGRMQRGIAALRAALRGRGGRMVLGGVLAAIVGAGAERAAADDRGLVLPGGQGVPPLETNGPFGSTIGIELYDRLRGGVVEFFPTPSNASKLT